MNKYSQQHITDQELLDRFYTDQDNEWLGILLERYVLLLFGVCIKYMKNEEEARDCVQQVFLKTITELQKYKVTYFKSWIYMVARNHCLMKLRDKTGKSLTHIVENTLSIEPEAISQENPRERDQLLEAMDLALQDLNPDQKLCVTLFYLDKKTYQQITEASGFSLLQVKSHIQNGKRNLKLMLEKKLQNKA